MSEQGGFYIIQVFYCVKYDIDKFLTIFYNISVIYYEIFIKMYRKKMLTKYYIQPIEFLLKKSFNHMYRSTLKVQST